MRKWTIAILAFLAVGCSAMKPHTQALKITCNVPDAIVKVNGDRVDVPGEIQVRRNSDGVLIEGYKEGYDRYNKTIYSHMSETAIADIVGTAVFLLPVFGLMSPGAWDLDQTEVHVVLNEVKKSEYEGSKIERRKEEKGDRNVHFALKPEKKEESTQPQIPSKGDAGEKIPQALPWVQKSYESLQKREWAEAIRTASVAISLDPNSAVSYSNRAWAYSEKGLFDKALEDCNSALKLDPNSALAYNNRGLTYKKMGQIKESKDDYEKACNLGLELACNNFKAITGYSPLDKAARANLLIKESQIRFEEKDWNEVIRISSEVIELTPNNDLAYSIRAGAYANKGLFHEAVNDCNSSIRINPDCALAYNNRGYAFELLGQVKEAQLDYEISCHLGLELGCHNLKKFSGGK